MHCFSLCAQKVPAENPFTCPRFIFANRPKRAAQRRLVIIVSDYSVEVLRTMRSNISALVCLSLNSVGLPLTPLDNFQR